MDRHTHTKVTYVKIRFKPPLHVVWKDEDLGFQLNPQGEEKMRMYFEKFLALNGDNLSECSSVWFVSFMFSDGSTIHMLKRV